MRTLLGLQLAKAKTPEDRAKVDLKLHFMSRTLDEPVHAHPHCGLSAWNCFGMMGCRSLPVLRMHRS